MALTKENMVKRRKYILLFYPQNWSKPNDWNFNVRYVKFFEGRFHLKKYMKNSQNGFKLPDF